MTLIGRTYRVTADVVYKDGSDHPDLRVFVVADNESEAARKVDAFVRYRAGGRPVRGVYPIQTLKLPAPNVPAGTDLKIGAIIFGDTVRHFRGPAPSVEWSELLCDILSGQNYCDDLLESEYPQLFEELRLQEVPTETVRKTGLDWIRAFSGTNGHSEYTLGRIAHWRGRGADVCCLPGRSIGGRARLKAKAAEKRLE